MERVAFDSETRATESRTYENGKYQTTYFGYDSGYIGDFPRGMIDDVIDETKRAFREDRRRVSNVFFYKVGI